MLYVLERDPSITIVGMVRDTDTSLVSRFTTGIMIDRANAPTNLSVDVESAPDEYPDYFELQQIPIVSSRLLAALRSAGVDNFAAYPAPIIEKTRQIDGHSVLHIIGRVAAVDAASSTVTRFAGRIARIRKLALAPGLATDLHIFRLDEKQYVILVSKKVRDALQGLSGVVLSPAEGWGDSHQF
jgi:hypothetical protein